MTTGADQLGTTARTPSDFAIGDELRGERATLGRSLLDVQRDLRIKAAYIAAIENADADVFPNPSFIPGYVRSYARYLGLDPAEVYVRFCAESGFRGAAAAQADRGRRAAAAAGAAMAPGAPAAIRSAGAFRPDFPMAAPRWPGVPALPLSAIGSVLMLLALVAGLGYGGWTVLLNIQRVQFAPVEELPLTASSVAELQPPETPAPAETAFSEIARPVAATALTDLYRQQELEVPILAPRDGPIAGIDPDRVGLHAAAAPSRGAPDAPTPGDAVPSAAQAAVAVADPAAAQAAQLTAPAEAQNLTVVAERAAWIRVYLADKTVVFERILETGESYSPPADLASPLIWAGNSGSVYVRLGASLRGPLGSGTRAVRDVVLEPAAIAARYSEVETVPESLTQAFEPAIAAAAIAIQ